MARVRVELPSLLGVATGGPLSLEVEAASLRTAWTAVTAACPGLRTHLFDETGALRQHVLCFHNGTNTRWLPAGDAPLRDGDVLTFLQAVSGG